MLNIKISNQNMAILLDALMNLPYRYVGELVQDLERQIVSQPDEQPTIKAVEPISAISKQDELTIRDQALSLSGFLVNEENKNGN